MQESEILIRFIPNLKEITGSKALCLPYANEIHIDKTLENDPNLQDYIKHESEHIQIWREHRQKGTHKFRQLALDIKRIFKK